jgi:hypothetical protein
MTEYVVVDVALMQIVIALDGIECTLRFCYEIDEVIEQGASLIISSNGMQFIFGCQFSVDMINNNIVITSGDGCHCDDCDSSYLLTIKDHNDQIKTALKRIGYELQ